MSSLMSSSFAAVSPFCGQPYAPLTASAKWNSARLSLIFASDKLPILRLKTNVSGKHNFTSHQVCRASALDLQNKFPKLILKFPNFLLGQRPFVTGSMYTGLIWRQRIILLLRLYHLWVLKDFSSCVCVKLCFLCHSYKINCFLAIVKPSHGFICTCMTPTGIIILLLDKI